MEILDNKFKESRWESCIFGQERGSTVPYRNENMNKIIT